MAVTYDSITSSNGQSILFNVLSNFPQLPQGVFKEITEEGVDGVALMFMGKKGERFVINGRTNAANAAAAAGIVNTARAMVGTQCSIIRQSLQYDFNTLIRVRNLGIEKALAVDGGVVAGGTYLIALEMEFVYTGAV